MTMDDLIMNLSMKMCGKQEQVQRRLFRNATADITEKAYLTDDIRKLYNGGDRFHPYV